MNYIAGAQGRTEGLLLVNHSADARTRAEGLLAIENSKLRIKNCLGF